MLKKVIINSIIVFILSALIHFLYSSIPFFLTSIVAPVNESTFEHMKMIFSAYMLFLVIRLLFFKKKENNLLFSFTITAIINIFIFLIIYLPLNKIIGKEIMWLTLLLYFISILISNFILPKFMEKEENKKLNIITIISIVLIYLIFTLLTYYPPKINFFLDKTNNMYGIYKHYY